MLQFDIFWSFAIGACFAAMAPIKGIKESNSMYVNKYFVACVSYLSMIFAPSGIYLLWQHDRWGTMFFLDKSMHGIWPCVFAHTNVSMGCLGFIICYRLVKHGHYTMPHAVWVTGYDCFFACLTFGYDRFLYAGTGSEFDNHVEYQIIDFLRCDVFKTIAVISLFLLPPLFYIMNKWPAEHGITSTHKYFIIRSAATTHIINTLIMADLYVLQMFWVRPTLPLGMDRVLAYVIGQVIFGIILLVPLFFIRVAPTDSMESEKKIH